MAEEKKEEKMLVHMRRKKEGREDVRECGKKGRECGKEGREERKEDVREGGR